MRVIWRRPAARPGPRTAGRPISMSLGRDTSGRSLGHYWRRLLKHRIVRAVGLAAAAAAIGLGALSPQPPILAAPSPGGYRAASPEYGLSTFLYGNPDTTDRDLA